MTAAQGKTRNRCLALTKAGVMEQMVFHTSMIVNIIANCFYLILIYFLWKAIYASSPTDVVNGMTFYDTMVYLVLASAMFNFMNNFVIWNIGDDYQSGFIVLQMTKPFDYQAYMFWILSGNSLTTFVTTFVPTFVIVCLVAHSNLVFGMNLLWFFVSLLLAFILNFFVDFCVGIICFYTESVWGVNTMKEVIVALLSAATIPLAFFPGAIQKVVKMLPFQAIYNSPLQTLTDRSLVLVDYARIIGTQIIWIVIVFGISRIFWRISCKKLTVDSVK